MKERFQNLDFQADSLALIEQVNAVLDRYQAQGYRLTLRQTYDCRKGRSCSARHCRPSCCSIMAEPGTLKSGINGAT